MICVDASVAAKWILEEERSDEATALYNVSSRRGIQLVAPPLMPFEVTNILRRRMRAQGGLSLHRATELLETFLALAIEIQHPAGMHRRALALAESFNLPAAYDAHYLALAEHFGCEFWTDDQQLLRQVGDRLSFVRPLAEYTG